MEYSVKFKVQCVLSLCSVGCHPYWLPCLSGLWAYVHLQDLSLQHSKLWIIYDLMVRLPNGISQFSIRKKAVAVLRLRLCLFILLPHVIRLQLQANLELGDWNGGSKELCSLDYLKLH